ncbi:efflux RND transporter periplasmic adaptor subunit [Pontibacter cellulosilyticus]|uniref:Efflux RND transporter periplasmic adaptor subunit n=1 Tax=Pontibacter cellulosilyticus TaxID=1720253 RepID=A0A923N9N5_9BACT|nr:efflux RND transporter periplasmic adaptor subunit [Pontibacter cellulosilyticus]MBC5994821.1 efflux RND transporter periplasmic adaptor subunit [Pontibacter cellulosilyticus]
MKKVLLGLFIILFLGLSGGLGYYFYKKSNTDPVVYKTEAPFETEIVKKTVATGSIVPRKEVQVKSQVSGIVQELYAEAGEVVKKGQLLAKIKIVPNMVSVNNAETQLQTAKLNFNEAKRELARYEQLYEQKVIPEQEYQKYKADYNLKREALQAAESNLLLVREGASRKSGQSSNLVYSTIDGMLLDVPVKVGTSIIERNNFNEGTTIATVADMRSLIFEGKIDESEVGKLKENMDLLLTIGAIENRVFDAKLEYIAPKGVLEEGSIKFPIRAKVLLDEKDFIRAGYSANADIVLDKRDKVLAIKESMLKFDKDQPYVEVETAPQVFEKRVIKTGLSDGINIEVVSGLDKKEKIKVPDANIASI